MKTLLFLTPILFLLACKHPLENPEIMDNLRLASSSPEYLAFIDFADHEANGHIYLTGSGADNLGQCQYTIGGNIADADGNKQPYGDLQVSSHTLTQVTNTEYHQVVSDNLEGQTVGITIKNTSNTNTEFLADLYFTPAVTLNLPGTISTGSTLTWNSDPNNTRGLLLQIEYGNDPADETNWSNFIGEKFIYLDTDDGSHTLTSDDLSDVSVTPTAPYMRFTLWRGDYEIALGNTDPLISCKFIYAVADSKYCTF